MVLQVRAWGRFLAVMSGDAPAGDGTKPRGACKNVRIVVLHGMSVEDVRRLVEVPYEFEPGGDVFAHFEPTNEGWFGACMMAKALAAVDAEESRKLAAAGGLWFVAGAVSPMSGPAASLSPLT